MNEKVRLKACQYMMKYIPKMKLKKSGFKELNYMISHYKIEKNKTELNKLKDYIEKYPLLKELYWEKLISVMVKLK